MSTIDETQLFENTINLNEVIADSEDMVVADHSEEHVFQTSKVEAVSTFQEQIRLQESSMTTIRNILNQIYNKSTVKFYFGILGFIFLASSIAVLVFMTRSKSSLMFFFSLLSGGIALVSLLMLIVEGFKFLQIRRDINHIKADVLKDNAMNVNEKKQGLDAFERVKHLLNGVTFLTTLVGADVKSAALEFQTLRCISDHDKARIIELRDHEKTVRERMDKALDQRKRLEEEIVNVTSSQQMHVSELEQLNEAVRTVPSLKNDFSIAHDRYNNLGGEIAEQALEHEWKTRVEEMESALRNIQNEKEAVAQQFEQLKKEAEQKYTESKNIKSDNDKQRNSLEKEKQKLLKKIEHAHTDFEVANKNIVETTEKIREIESRMFQVTSETERNDLTAEKVRLEDRMKKHVGVAEKAKNFIDTSNPTEYDMKIASVQSNLLKYTRETEEMIHFYEGEVNKLQNELNRKSREVLQTEETLKLRQTQRQEALRPFQEQVEIMLGLDKKIREIMQKDRNEKPSLEAKIEGITQRIDHLIMDKSALEIKVRDDQQRLSLIEDEVQNLSNNFIN